MPTIQHLESEDGSCSLTFEGRDSAPQQAGGGSMYLLRISRPEGDVEVRATVQSTTSFDAERQAKAEGIDYMALPLTEALPYLEQFSNKYGRSWYIVVCRVSQNGKYAGIAEAVATFCKMFFDMMSSYRFNNPDYPGCGEGHYPDRVDFSPWSGVDKEYFREFSSREMFND